METVFPEKGKENIFAQKKKTIVYHQRAIELDPRFGKAYSGLGLAHFDLNEYEQAKESFLKAIDLGYSALAALYFSLLVFLNYVVVCFIFRALRNERWVWAVMGGLILLSLLDI